MPSHYTEIKPKHQAVVSKSSVIWPLPTYLSEHPLHSPATLASFWPFPTYSLSFCLGHMPSPQTTWLPPPQHAEKPSLIWNRALTPDSLYPLKLMGFSLTQLTQPCETILFLSLIICLPLQECKLQESRLLCLRPNPWGLEQYLACTRHSINLCCLNNEYNALYTHIERGLCA